MAVFEIFFVILLFIYQAETKDICTRNAILKRSEEIYMSRETKHEIEYDFTDFLVTMNKIKSAKVPFVKEISEYSTMDQLKAMVIPDLIPFNNRVNLVFANDTATKVIAKCNKLKASVFSFESQKEISEMSELMITLGLDSIGFIAFALPIEIISRTSQKFLFKTPSGVDAALINKAKLVMMNKNQTIHIRNEASETTVNAFCSFPASPFSSLNFDEFEARSWIKIVGRSLNSLKLFDKLYSDLKENLETLKTEERGNTRAEHSVTWTVPAEVLRAQEFITHYDHDKAWDSSTGEILYELSQFVDDIMSINDYISDRLKVEGRRLVIYPKYETEGYDGMSMRQVTLVAKITDASGENKLILRGEALGKSLHEAHKVTLYKAYSHGFGRTRPVDSIVVADGVTYRAVSTFEELGWECSTKKAKKICTDNQQTEREKQEKCGEYLFGKTGNYNDCPQKKVDRPLIYGSLCGNENEVLSSYYKDYKLSLWCNGYLAENLDLKPGLSTILTKCEVRSEDGQTIYTHQVGASVDRNVIVTKLGSYLKSEASRIIEDVLGWPVTGTLMGSGAVITFVIIICCVKYIGVARCKRMFRAANGNNNPRVVEAQEMQPLRGRGADLHIYNINTERRGQIVPRQPPFMR